MAISTEANEGNEVIFRGELQDKNSWHSRISGLACPLKILKIQVPGISLRFLRLLL
jgi:hypothetical protein